jgi:hypothetical protein
MDKDEMADALWEVFVSHVELNEEGNPANITDGLFEIARALNRIAAALERPENQMKASEENVDHV